ncbi:hypothetical protein CF326_g7404 [Tilletia indica]|nr:hypothetical protein CF326_g7404 [Tilletia indica]
MVEAEKWSDVPQEEQHRILDMLAAERTRLGRMPERGAAAGAPAPNAATPVATADFEILSASMSQHAGPSSQAHAHNSSQRTSFAAPFASTGSTITGARTGIDSEWRPSTSTTTGSGSSGSSAAAKFSYLSGRAPSTVRGRASSGRPIPPIKVLGNKIQLLPARAWGKHMTSVGKPEDLDVFLLRQRCEINSNQIKVSFSPAEVMQTIISEFKQKGWNLAETGFRYGTVRGKKLELIPADLKTHEADGNKLEDTFAKFRCFVVMETDDWPIEFKKYFRDSATPPVEDQKKETLSECDHCLLILPRSSLVDHIVECPRATGGFPEVPRTTGEPNTVGGGAPIDLGAREFWRANTAGIHLPDAFQFDNDRAIHQRNAQRLSDWDDPKAWCLCKGIGAGKDVDWVECSQKRKCPVRWYHYDCMAAAAGVKELEFGWKCFPCIRLEERLPKNKRRHQDIDLEDGEDEADEGPAANRARH